MAKTDTHDKPISDIYIQDNINVKLYASDKRLFKLTG